MTDEELIARLRSAGKHPMMDNNCKVDVFDVHSAADRIEALVKDKERLGREVNMARYGQPDFAWSGWKDIATAPRFTEILGRWSYVYHGDTSPTVGHSLGEVDDDGAFWDYEGKHAPGLFTHWYDFGDGKPMPDAPEVE